MSILIAFWGGMLTLLSPCTLPVIPLLFASVRGRRGQLAIMLAGMALMFGAVSWLVTVASGWVVNLTLAGRGLALAFFALVGLSLLSQRVAQRLTSPLVALGNQLNDASSRQRGWIGSLLAYGSGGALMLFLLGWCGAALIARLRRGQAFGERLRRLAGGAMLASVALIASGGDRYLQSAGGLSQALEQRLAARLPQPEQKTSLQPIAAPQPSSAMPSLAGGSAWINSPALTPERLKGNVVLVDFWTRECINCQHTLPYVRDWANKYRAAGLVVIGVHTPEYPWERSLPLLRQAVKDWRITYPVVADNEYAIWNAFGNQYWPAHYIFDARGQLRYTAFGEGDYARQEQVIQQLLQESKA
ncbi:TPA: redoxin domain-containing protein [Klebsiella pneumoniae]|nr:redoxin domain-containing protein [Klebsiella pneumoniae]HCM6894832.1 redoxin domain-containing protein [Klebsiella pneumoniae]HCM7836559.1 redoxin domain-containing protein [Klebsiella pneumoniae]